MKASRTGQVEKQSLTEPGRTAAGQATPHPMGEGLDALLTQDEVAARLKVTVRTVIRLQHDGVVPVIELGKAVRFYWPSVISHLVSNFTVCRSLRSATIPPANGPHGPITNLHGQQTNQQTGAQGTGSPT